MSSKLSIEDIYVKYVYNSISKEFSETRYRPWSCVERFSSSLNSGSLIGDIGCGNGKNMNHRDDCSYMGCDFSEGLVSICKTKGLDVSYGDILSLPYTDNTFDHTMCIAVIHHLSTIDKRKKAIEELIRVTKKGGKIFILVWALEQGEDSKRKFVEQENFVDWKDKKGKLLGKRYYYVFKDQELKDLIPESYQIKEFFYEKGNWGIIFEV